MKLDQEFLLKQRFWVLLCVSVPLTLVALFMVASVVAAPARKAREDIDRRFADIKKLDSSKNDLWVKLAKEDADRAKAQETEVWRKAWQQQQDVIGWPARLESAFHFKEGLFALVIAIQGKDANLKELPEDTPNLLHGTLTSIDEDYIWVTPRKGERQKFQRVAKPKIFRTEEPDKELSPEDFFKAYNGKNAVVAITFQKGKYFGDDLTAAERSRYMDSYKEQTREVLEEAGPLNALDETLVQFKGWTFRKGDFVAGKGYVWKDADYPPKGAKFFRYVTEQWKGEQDISEEAWTAQEDLCIQREMFRLVRQANDYVARFKPESQSDDGRIFKGKNPYWQLELKLEGDKLHVKVLNLLERRQRIDVRFRVQFDKDKAFQVIPRLDRDALGPRGSAGELEDPAKPGTKRIMPLDVCEEVLDAKQFRGKRIYAVEQVLTWDTAAVKRIDQTSFGIGGSAETSHSHRTSNRQLVPYRKKAEVKAENPDPMGGDGDIRPKGLPREGLPREGLGGEGAINATLSANGLILDRYLGVTPQARRIPVAMALIVDQEHVHRVLNSFADSKFRFLITQVVWHRYPQSVRPPDVQPVGEIVDPNDPTRPLFTPPDPRRPPRIESGGDEGTMRPPVAIGGAEDQESNVELVIYGIATLYERFPPRQPQASGDTEKK